MFSIPSSKIETFWTPWFQGKAHHKVMLTFEGNMACSSFKVKKAEYTFSFPTAARTPNFNFIHFFTFSTSSRFAAIFLIQKKKFWLGNFWKIISINLYRDSKKWIWKIIDSIKPINMNKYCLKLRVPFLFLYFKIVHVPYKGWKSEV